MNWEKLLTYGLVVVVAYFAADLGILATRSSLLPEKLPASRPAPIKPPVSPNTGIYDRIITKNIFNSDGKILELQGGQAIDGSPDAPAVLSNLPLLLLGTIVHANPKRSVATIELKTKSEITSLRVGDIIPDNLAEITKIERLKVTFRVKSSGRMEYIEIKDDSKISIGVSKPSKVDDIGGTETDKTVNRGWLDSQLKDLPTLLQQAASAPVYDAQGKVTGYRILRIQSGSVYERIGVRERDVIQAVNGESIDGPQKAADLFNALRNSNSISLQVERDGRRETINFMIQ